MNCFIVIFGVIGNLWDLSDLELFMLDFFFDVGDLFFEIEIGLWIVGRFCFLFMILFLFCWLVLFLNSCCIWIFLIRGRVLEMFDLCGLILFFVDGFKGGKMFVLLFLLI